MQAIPTGVPDAGSDASPNADAPSATFVRTPARSPAPSLCGIEGDHAAFMCANGNAHSDGINSPAASLKVGEELELEVANRSMTSRPAEVCTVICICKSPLTRQRREQ